MALSEDIGHGARKLLVPAAASIAGAGAGLMLTRKSVRKAMPEIGDLGLGELADDLRAKLDSAIGKGQALTHGAGASQGRRIDSRELHQRLREREQRRNSRRARS
jgi:hypothetical protein